MLATYTSGIATISCAGLGIYKIVTEYGSGTQSLIFPTALLLILGILTIITAYVDDPRKQR